MKLLMIVLAVLFMTGCEFKADVKFNPSVEYCEMWKEWHDSNGEYGWPDPNNVYDEEC